MTTSQSKNTHHGDKKNKNLNAEQEPTGKRQPKDRQLKVQQESLENLDNEKTKIAKSKVETVVSNKIKIMSVCQICYNHPEFPTKTQLRNHVKFAHPNEFPALYPAVPDVVKTQNKISAIDSGVTTRDGLVAEGLPEEETVTAMGAALAAAMNKPMEAASVAARDVIEESPVEETPVVEADPEPEPVVVSVVETPVTMVQEEKPQSIEEKLISVDVIEQQVLHQIRALAQEWLDSYTVVLKKYDASRKEYDARATKLDFLKKMIEGFPQFMPQYNEGILKLASAWDDLDFWKKELDKQEQSAPANVVRMYNLHPTTEQPKVAPKIQRQEPIKNTGRTVKGEIAKLINGMYEYTYKGARTNSQKGAVSYCSPLLNQGITSDIVSGKLIRNVLPTICEQNSIEFSPAEVSEWAAKMIEKASRKLEPVASK